MQATGANLEPMEAILAESGWLRSGRFGCDGDRSRPLDGGVLCHGRGMICEVIATRPYPDDPWDKGKNRVRRMRQTI